MRDLSRYDQVEKVRVPHRYQAPACTHTYAELCNRYEELKHEYIKAIERIDDANRAAWSTERLAETIRERLDIAEKEIQRLAEAGRYAVYGKPEISTFDEEGTEEHDSKAGCE